MVSLSGLLLIPAILAGLSSLLYNPVKFRLEQLGVTRHADTIKNFHGSEPTSLRVIPSTVQCEDLHHHQGLIFAACQDPDLPAERHSWFPPLANFDDPHAITGGRLVEIDPITFTSRTLDLEGFDLPFVTHGIDVLADPTDPTSIYIFAVNHLPNPEYYSLSGSALPNVTSKTPKARSQIEVFHHKLRSQSALHIRSVRHPLLRTPNDIVATTPRSFYVTNDHHYRSGLKRDVEDLFTQYLAPWSELAYVTFDGKGDDDEGVNVEIAIDKEHNPNGLGRGASPDEIVLTDAIGGVVTRLQSTLTSKGLSLRAEDRTVLPHAVDNPSFYSSEKASGYVIAGLLRGCDLAAKRKIYIPPGGEAWDPLTVTFIPRAEDGAILVNERRTLFQDTGKTLRSASIALIVKKEAEEWLYVSGFFSLGVIAVRVEI